MKNKISSEIFWQDFYLHFSSSGYQAPNLERDKWVDFAELEFSGHVNPAPGSFWAHSPQHRSLAYPPGYKPAPPRKGGEEDGEEEDGEVAIIDHLDGDLGHQVEGVRVEPRQVSTVPLHQQLAQHCSLAQLFSLASFDF